MIIQSTRVYYEESYRPLQIEVEGSKIIRILPYGTKKADKDYGDYKITPGFIDIHCHGYGGQTVNTATPEWIDKWCRYLVSEGVTAIVPASSSHEQSEMFRGLSVVADYMEKETEGAQVLGLYSEGPFMCEKYHGAQDLRYLTVPDIDTLDAYQKACKGHLIYVMVAPEMFEGDMSFIEECVKRGIVVTLGHTGATFEDVTKARAAGATAFTHTFNGMRGLHHREPGVVGAAMYYDDMFCELIGDGVHVNSVVANVLARIKGKDRLITVTDSEGLKGYPLGEYEDEEGNKVYVCEDGTVRLSDGTLTGSALKLNKLVYHQIAEAGIDEVTIINSVTVNPCRLLHFDTHKGKIAVGYDADLAVFTDTFDAVETYVMGVSRYQAK